jgi:2-polyprenyl-3-methyl-5-hydroxy-6-metoxy-1,4-benzoquinol methylase
MEDFYGYPATTPPGLWKRLRKLFLWPEKVRRVFSGRNILPWIGRGRLLDVGCGQGVNMATLHNMGWDVHGVDFSETAVEEAHELFGDHVKLGDFLDVHYDDRSFDVVLFNHSLEHLSDPVSALREARRILDDEGVLVVAVPNAGSMEARLFGRWWFPWDPPRHLYHFGKAPLSRLLNRAGFRVVRLRTGVGALFFMTSLDSVWRHVYGGRKLPLRIVIEKLIARPFSLLMGHLGLGTDITVYAVKA